MTPEQIKSLPYMSMRLRALADWLEAGGAGIEWNWGTSCHCVSGHLFADRQGYDPDNDPGYDEIEEVVGRVMIKDYKRYSWKKPVPISISEFIYIGFEPAAGEFIHGRAPDESTLYEDIDYAVATIRALARRIEVLLKDIEEDAAITKVEAPEADWEEVPCASI